MDPLTALATIDALLTAGIRAEAWLSSLRAEGVITPEQQAARLGEVAKSRVLAGLPIVGAQPEGV